MEDGGGHHKRLCISYYVESSLTTTLLSRTITATAERSCINIITHKMTTNTTNSSSNSSNDKEDTPIGLLYDLDSISSDHHNFANIDVLPSPMPLPPSDDTDPKIFLQTQFKYIEDVNRYYIPHQNIGIYHENWIPAGLPYEMWKTQSYSESSMSTTTTTTTTFLYIMLNLISKLCLPLCPIMHFFYQCPFTISILPDIAILLGTNVSLIYLIEIGKLKFKHNFMVRVKRGVYFNTQTKTVFKFLTDSTKIIDFLFEAILCYNYGDFIGTKRCLTFYPHIMCAEYSYEGPDIRCLFSDNTNMLYYTSLMYDEVGSEVFNQIHMYFIENILQILSSFCNIAKNLSKLGISFSDFKPDNFAFNKVTQKVILIDGEMIYPFEYKRQVKNMFPSVEKMMEIHPQTPPEFFIDGQFSEYSTVYGLQHTLSEIMSSVYHGKNLNMLSSYYWDKTLYIIDMINEDDTYKKLSRNARNVQQFRRPTVQDFLNFFNKKFVSE